MSRFVDTYAPETMPGYPCITIPRWHTQIQQVASGDEQANQKWTHPLHQFILPQAVRKYADYAAVATHWYAMRGPLYTWPFRDPLDFASVTLDQPNQLPGITGMDQAVGTGDGVTTDFQLIKAYTVGTQTYNRNILLPITATLIVTVDGVDQNTSPTLYTVSRPGGVVSFFDPPTLGAVIKAGFFFDVQVRFESDDSFGGMVKNWQTAGHSDITLIEVRNCDD